MSIASRLLGLALLLTAPALLAAAAGLAGGPPPPPSADSAASSDYTLQPGDTISVTILGEEGLSNQMKALKVSPERTIRITYFEDAPINVSGKTRWQLENIITSLYKPDYLKQPNVSVQIISYAPRKVNVIGQVNSPHEVQFPPEKGLKLIDAITQCGGFTRLGDDRNVVLTRVMPDGTKKNIPVDARKLTGAKAAGGDDYPLQPDDIIFVPEI
jgi:polysaccharide export outer membrane protein